jgi:hypothetical protein
LVYSDGHNVREDYSSQRLLRPENKIAVGAVSKYNDIMIREPIVYSPNYVMSTPIFMYYSVEAQYQNSEPSFSFHFHWLR